MPSEDLLVGCGSLYVHFVFNGEQIQRFPNHHTPRIQCTVISGTAHKQIGVSVHPRTETPLIPDGETQKSTSGKIISPPATTQHGEDPQSADQSRARLRNGSDGDEGSSDATIESGAGVVVVDHP